MQYHHPGKPLYNTNLLIMMKLLLSLTLIWMLSSTAGALKCFTCTDQQCSNTASATCSSSETMCITASILATKGGTTGQQIYKACASPSLCPATASQTFSANLGVSGAVASTKCCNTDDCNSETLSSPSSQSPNGLQCNICDPLTSQCTTPLPCAGTEDRCFQATVTDGTNTSPAFGCASENLCLAASSLGALPFMENVGSISSGPACCDSNLCNTGTTTAAPTTTTTTTTPAPTTTTTTTTPAPTTTTTTPAPTTTTTTPAPTTTTTTTSTSATQPATTTTTASDACCIRLGVIHLLLGLLVFSLY